MKKAVSLVLCIALILCAASGCAGEKKEDRISVVATIFPPYDWVRQIVGDKTDRVDLTLLLDNGVDLHSYQPTVEDIIKISRCDLFLFVGGESDSWVEDVLAEAKNPDMLVVNLLETLGDSVKEEEIVPGMETEKEGEESGEEEIEYDEHVWLSLENTLFLCRAICEKLCRIDEENRHVYTENTDLYLEKVRQLDKAYRDAVSSAPVKTLLFGDRFPFRYMTDDYGLDYYAAFAGCSAETEASFETILFLSSKVDELDLHTILQIEGSDGSIARTIRDATKKKDQEIRSLNSLQSVTAKDVENGVTYLSVMEKNLSVLKDALR